MTREEMILIKESRGYSYKMISDYSGVPVVTIQKIFAGTTKNPRTATLQAIERVLSSDEKVYTGKSYEYEHSGRQSFNYELPAKADAVHESSAAYEIKNHEKKQGEYTLEDYNALPEDKRFELIDGVLYEMNSPRVVHQDIASIVHMAIYDYFRKNKGTCKVFEAAVDVQIDCDDKTMVQPDVLIVCDRSKIKGFGIYGAPDFILEILSPSTRKKDMTIKLAKYESAGVKEYWIIDPKTKTLVIYNFMDENWFPQVLPLKGTAGLNLYNKDLLIDLDEIAASIDEFEN